LLPSLARCCYLIPAAEHKAEVLMQVDDTLADEGGAVQLNLLVCLVINACQLLARILFKKNSA
jgi:hypothetical protein